MRLKASFTIENTVIIPLFTFIILLLIILTLYIHDTVIIKNGVYQNIIKTEQYLLVANEQERDNTIRQYDAQLMEYLREKTIGVTSIQLKTRVTDNEIVTEYKAAYGMISFLGKYSNISRSITLKKGYPPDYIRKIKALQELA